MRAFLLLTGLLVLAACRFEQQTFSTDSETQFMQLGRRVYQNYCATCHQPNGQGVPGIYPPLTPNEWVQGDKGRLIRLILHGAQGEMRVGEEVYNNVMTAHDFLTDEQIAAVLTFVRQHFGNQAEPVSPEEVAAVRAASRQQEPWDPAVLWEQTGIPETGSGD